MVMKPFKTRKNSPQKPTDPYTPDLGLTSSFQLIPHSREEVLKILPGLWPRMNYDGVYT
jgi:hypothetical protein